MKINISLFVYFNVNFYFNGVLHFYMASCISFFVRSADRTVAAKRHDLFVSRLRQGTQCCLQLQFKVDRHSHKRKKTC